MKQNKKTLLLLAAAVLFSVTLLSCTMQSPYDEINDKIIVLFQKGNYSEAQKLDKEALTMAKEKFGEDHQKTAFSMDTLAMIYKTQGKFGEAEPLYEKALAIHEKFQGPNLAGVIHVLENMVELYKAMGRDDEVKKLTARIEKIRSY